MNIALKNFGELSGLTEMSPLSSKGETNVLRKLSLNTS
jgi:hypothetical protein